MHNTAQVQKWSCMSCQWSFTDICIDPYVAFRKLDEIDLRGIAV